MVQPRSFGFDGPARDAFGSMLLLNSQRGAHSTGMFGVEGRKTSSGQTKVSVVKKVGSPFALFAEEDTRKFSGKIFRDFHAVVGHGRFATSGKVNAANAHPFYEDNIVLVHNGNIRNLDELKVGDRKMKDVVDVDSRAAAVMLNHMSIDEFFGRMRGDFAMIWVDKRTNCLYALRNSARPLYMTFREKTPGVFFSSEDSVFNYIESKYDITCAEYIDCEPGTLYEFPLNNGLQEVEMKTREIKLANNYSHFSRASWDNYGMSHHELHASRRDEQRQRPEGARDFPDASDSNFYSKYTWKNGFWVPKKPHITVTQGGGVTEGNIPKVKWEGKEYKQGSWQSFWVTEIVELAANAQHKIVKGSACDSDKVEVILQTREDVSVLSVGDIIAGRISKIIYLEAQHDYVFRLHVQYPQKVPTAEQNLILAGQQVDLDDVYSEVDKELEKKSDVLIPVKGGKSLPLQRFSLLAKMKCARCEADCLDETNAHQCLQVSDNPQASKNETDHGGLYCPACSDAVSN